MSISKKKISELQEYGKTMLLKHGFLYIDIPRTSSTSIRVELGQKFGVPYAKSNTLEGKYSQPQIFSDHLPAKTMKKIIGTNNWEKIFVFTLVRNPWDRIYSLYKWRIIRKNIPVTLEFRKYILELQKYIQFIRNENKTYDINDDTKKLFKFKPHYMSCSKYIFDDDGENLLDFIGKYENRHNDLKKVSKNLGLKSLGNLHTQEACGATSHYSEHYDNETKDIIADIYDDDIKNFNYSF